VDVQDQASVDAAIGRLKETSSKCDCTLTFMVSGNGHNCTRPMAFELRDGLISSLVIN